MKTAPAAAAAAAAAGSYRLAAVARFPGGVVEKGKKHAESRKVKKLSLCKAEL